MISKYGREYDEIVGPQVSERYICCCSTAFSRCGLTSWRANLIQAWTIYPEINRVRSWYTQFFFNPLMYDHFGEDCKPSPFSKNILEPTQERTIVEGVFYREYMDEGILIEGLQNYIESHKDDCSLLYDLAPKYRLKEKDLTYWLNEAREESDMSMG